MSDCVFCGIAAGNVPASKVWEDDNSCAFLDIRPVNSGHILVIPNRHAASLEELEEADGAELFEVARRLAAALRRSGVKCEGVNLHLADGPAAGQEVFHVHLHVIPRFKGDGCGLRLPPGFGANPPRPELEALAEKIRNAL